MIVKKHLSQGRLILAVCDKELLGQCLSNEECNLDLGSSFYNGEEMTKEEAQGLMKQSYIINIAGEESLEAVVELGYTTKESAKLINGIPHAQVLVIRPD